MLLSPVGFMKSYFPLNKTQVLLRLLLCQFCHSPEEIIVLSTRLKLPANCLKVVSVLVGMYVQKLEHLIKYDLYAVHRLVCSLKTLLVDVVVYGPDHEDYLKMTPGM